MLIDGVWRCAFAFDENRKAILFIAGDKSGKSATEFYKGLIKKADERFDAHIARLKIEKAAKLKQVRKRPKAKRSGRAAK
jgi:hypothetical protein